CGSWPPRPRQGLRGFAPAACARVVHSDRRWQRRPVFRLRSKSLSTSHLDEAATFRSGGGARYCQTDLQLASRLALRKKLLAWVNPYQDSFKSELLPDAMVRCKQYAAGVMLDRLFATRSHSDV